jgi:hypothetical protein
VQQTLNPCRADVFLASYGTQAEGRVKASVDLVKDAEKNS